MKFGSKDCLQVLNKMTFSFNLFYIQFFKRDVYLSRQNVFEIRKALRLN